MASSLSSKTPKDKSSIKEVFIFPTSFSQRRLWFLYQFDPTSFIYNISAQIRVIAPLDVEALEQSFREIVRRHESLRTTFRAIDGEPMQIVAPSQMFNFEEIVDLSSVPEGQGEAEVERLARQEAQQPFDLAQGPLLRVKLLRRGAQDHVLLLTMHHIVSDGWSLAVLMYEASVLYRAFSAGKPSPLHELPIQYVDFSAWQQEWLQGGVLKQQLAYWTQQLAGAPAALELPTDRPRPALQSHRGAQQAVRLEPALGQKLRALGRQHGATLYMILLAAFQTLLARYTGQEDIVVGSPIAGRTRTATEGLIGFFVNTLVMRTNLSGSPSFRELLRRVKEVTLEAYAHQDAPFEKLVEVLSPQRDLSRNPLFQVMFILQNAPTPHLDLGAMQLQLLFIGTDTAKFELTLSLEEIGEGIEGYLEYNTDLFDRTTIERMVGHYQTLLTRIVAQPEESIATLPLLTEVERQQLLVEWNGTTRAFPERSVHDLFEEQVEGMPEAVAVKSEREELTYRELNRRANQLARYLRSLGVGAEVSVGVFLEPSSEMLVGVLGILKAGGNYVPLDPVFPKDRISYILEDSHVPVLLTHTAMKARFTAPDINVLFLDEATELLTAYDETNLPGRVAFNDRIYTIYTSGSTGRPKGVGVEQRQVLNYLYALMQRFNLKPGTQYAMLQPLAVDSCITVLIPAICAGGTLHVIPRDRAADPDIVLSYFRRHRIDVLKIAPSHLAALLEAYPCGDLLPHDVLALGGEASHWDWVRTTVRPLAPSTSKIFIHYGPTEATVGMLTYCIEPDAVQHGSLVPIGRPLPNTRVYVLGAEMQLVPVGVAGEVYIGGDCVARGYINRPDLTAERFVPDPFGYRPGARLYRTGDLARWLPEGEIEFLGRTDYQVKVRGFRIELGEIEEALKQHPSVKRVLAIARNDGATGKQLVAYVVPKGAEFGGDLSDKENVVESKNLSARLRDFLKDRLPDYMLPSAIVIIEALPLGPQGKVDLLSLPVPSQEIMSRECVEKPHTIVQTQLVKIWEEVLETSPISITDNFFQLGGHSLLAVRMMTMIRKQFKHRIPLASLFRNPTIAHLAQLLEPSEALISSLLVEIQPKGSGTPFFCIHPIGGNVLCYAELAMALGCERPFYGLQAPSWDTPHVPITSIQQMASLYNEQIRSVQPEGPYFLGGWSMGGLVAFEMARQLSQHGKKIGLLVLFDTYPPPRNTQIDEEESLPILVRFAADISRLTGKDPGELRERFLQLDEDEQRAIVLKTMKQGGMLAEDASQEEMNNMLSVFTRNSLAIDMYSLQPSEHRIVLFHAIGSLEDRKERERFVQQWEPWAGRVEIHPVAGDHYSMLKRPAVSAVAEKLKCCFEEAQQEINTASHNTEHRGSNAY